MKRAIFFLVLLLSFQFAVAKGPLSTQKETLLLQGFQEPHTPKNYNQTGYLRYYSKGENPAPQSKIILVLVSGFISGPGWFDRMARHLVSEGNLEVWIMIRRQSFLEDRKALLSDLHDFLKNPVPNNPVLKKINQTGSYLPQDLSFLAYWGFETQMLDLKLIMEEAKRQSPRVFLGGWSDGVEYAMLYSAKRFEKGQPGSGDIEGLVLLDEDPEWGRFSGFQSRKQAQDRFISAKNYYFNYHPSLPIYSLALYLANRQPNMASPLTHLFSIPEALKQKGITNKALIGWIFEAKTDFQGRGPFSYYVSSGNFDHKAPTDWQNLPEKNTKIEDLIEAEQDNNPLFEWAYPRKIIRDYWEIGECGFSCPLYRLETSAKSHLRIFYTLSGPGAGGSISQGLQWFLKKSGIPVNRVTFLKFPGYGHADWFFAKDAAGKVYLPMYQWLMSGRKN